MRDLTPGHLLFGSTALVLIISAIRLYVLIRIQHQLAKANWIPWQVLWLLPVLVTSISLPINYFADRYRFPNQAFSAGFSAIVLAPFAAFAIALVEEWLARPYRRKGYCFCGYNLTGNVSGVCPECGRSIK